ncbi:MAG: transposase [Chloroflexota bacterium]|nr:transposase [Chloroflexota bacterium]
MTYDSIHDPAHLYFVTATICGWKELLSEPKYARIIIGSLDWLRDEGRIYLFAFVLMPTHLHVLIKPRDRSIGDVLQNFGSFTAHEIIKQLKSDSQIELLNFFRTQRRDNRSQYSIWQDIQALNIFTRKVLYQKIEYIHNNPVSKEWNLVKDRADYQYSSACYYDRDEQAVIKVDDIRDYLSL